MKRLNVYVEKKGLSVQVGYIDYTSVEDAKFSYSYEYMADTDSHPISISLPFQPEYFNSRTTKSFFEGLLPEGFTRKSVAQHLKVSENDYLSILSELGTECIGAVKILKENNAFTDMSYEHLALDQIKMLAAEGAGKTAELAAKSHLSLTGASGKVGLYYDDINNEWYLPKGSAPSTHIVKQSHVRLNDIVTNEQLCLLTAKNIGIDTPDSFILNTGDGSDDSVLFATKRYDRFFSEDCSTIDGQTVPLRLHQEDMAQAMGIPALEKYEKPGDDYLKRIFDVVRLNSVDPISDHLKLWDMTVFNYLIGNADNHLKNHSIVYNENLSGIRLAPAYDVISTVVYESASREMGMSINNKLVIDDITDDDFVSEAQIVGVAPKIAKNRLNKLRDDFENALSDAAAFLQDQGFAKALTIKEQILKDRMG